MSSRTPNMQDTALLLAVLLVIVGLVGVVVPGIPGPPLLFAGLFLAAWAEDFVYVAAENRCYALDLYSGKTDHAYQVPTLAESGFPDFDIASWQGLLAPAGTPPAIVTRLNQEIVRYLQSADGRNAFLKAGIEAAGSTPEELTARMKWEMATYGKVLKAAGITPP